MKDKIPTILLVYATSVNQAKPSIFLESVLKEFESLYSIFSEIEERFNIVQHPYSTKDALIKTLKQHRDNVVILHFAGHTNHNLWELDDGAITSEGLAGILSLQSNIKLLFLNGCSNIEQSVVFQSSGIPAVIATRSNIKDNLAEEFSSHFYSHLVSSLNIDSAFKAAESVILMSPEKAKELRSLGLSSGGFQPWLLTLNVPAAGKWNLFDSLNDDSIGLPPYPKSILPPKKPFKHIAFYDYDDAPIFFGRNNEIKNLLKSLETPQPILLTYGQTGVGKSSLLAAGLVPRLQQFTVFYLRYSSDKSLVFKLDSILKLDNKSVTWQEFEEANDKPLIIILDQLEEAFSSEQETSRKVAIDFLNFIGSVFESTHDIQGKVILSFRKEWLAEVESLCEERGLSYTSHFIEHLSRNKIIECIEGVSKKANLTSVYRLSIPDENLPAMIADGLMTDKLSNRGPILQILMSSMWDSVVNDENRKFTIELYENVSRDGVLLSDYFNQTLIDIGNITKLENVVSKGLLLDILFLHTTPYNSTKNIPKNDLLKSYSHIGSALPLVMKELINRYLLTEPHDPKRFSKHQSTRLSHDTFAPIIREKVEQSDASGIRARRVLTSFKSQWLLKNSDQKIILDEAGNPRLKDNYPVLSDMELSLINEGRSGASNLDRIDQYILKSAEVENRRNVQGKNSLLFLLVITSITVSWSYLMGLI